MKKQRTILITNDDGIEAPGILLLAELAREFGEAVVVAPSSQCSAMSQRLTLKQCQSLVSRRDAGGLRKNRPAHPVCKAGPCLLRDQRRLQHRFRHRLLGYLRRLL